MYCIKCGKKIEEKNSFCVNCGYRKESEILTEEKEEECVVRSDVKVIGTWWQRLLRVMYIISYLPLVAVVLVTWFSNNSDYVCTGYGYSASCYTKETYGEAFAYSLLAVLVYVTIIRLIKIALKYIIYGKRPFWDDEIKKWL